MPRAQKESQRRLGQFTQIHRNRWQDRRWTHDLSWNAKAMYSQLETFDGISAAGVVRADAEILAQKHYDVTAEQVESYLHELCKAQFIDRSGSEVFVKDWFLRHPSHLRAEKNLKSMLFAINRIGYDDLREVVAKALFDSILEIERVDKTPTVAKVKNLLTEFAQNQRLQLPEELMTTASKKS